MSQLSQWIAHRASRLGLGWPDDVACAAGVDRARLARLDHADQGLLGLGRSARAGVARSLKVSVRELERLARGQIDWIDDQRVVDMDVLPGRVMLAPPAPCHVAAPSGTGTPVLGRITEDGEAELLDDVAGEEVERLGFRYRGAPDAFALRVEGSGWRRDERTDRQRFEGFAVFQPVVPGDLGDGETALLTLAADLAVARLAIVQRVDALNLRLIPLRSSASAVAHELPLIDVLRSARLL